MTTQPSPKRSKVGVSSQQYALWLCPATGSQQATALEQLIKDNAASALFEPHVTLAGSFQSSDLEAVTQATRQLASALPPQLSIEFSGVNVSTTYHQCVFLSVAPNESLLAAHQRACQAYALPSEFYHAHLSLVYSDCTLAQRVATAAAVTHSTAASLKQLSFACTNLQLWCCPSSCPSSWSRVAEFPLGEPAAPSSAPGRRPAMLELSRVEPGGSTWVGLQEGSGSVQQLCSKYDTLLVRVVQGWEMQALSGLNRMGKTILFYTDDSCSSCDEIASELMAGGCGWVEASHVITSSWAAADFLKTFHPSVNKAFVLGSPALAGELARADIQAVGGSVLDSAVGAVVCGLDTDFSYEKLALASAYLERGAVLVGTDRNGFQRHGTRNRPGCGALLAAIEASHGNQLEAMSSSAPSQLLLQRIVQKFELEPARTLVLGPELHQDVAWAKAGGLGAALVAHSPEELQDRQWSPDYVVESLQVFQDVQKEHNAI